jgi:hypothetical protein
MKLKFIVVLSLLIFKSNSQSLYGFSLNGSGFSNLQKYDLTTDSLTTFNTIINNWSYCSSSMDPNTGRYFYITPQMTNSLVIMDTLGGTLLDSLNFGQLNLQAPKYYDITNSVYGITDSGFVSIDVNSGQITYLNNHTEFYTIFNSTIDPVNGRYIYVSQAYSQNSNDTVITFDMLTGNTLDKTLISYGDMEYPQYSVNTGRVYGLDINNNFVELDLATGNLVPLSAIHNGVYYLNQQSAYDLENDRFYYIKHNWTGTDTLVTISAVNGIVLDQKPFGNDRLYNMCYFKAKPPVINTTGVPEYNRETGLKVYPNPSNGILNLEVSGDSYTLSITDISGRVLKNSLINDSKTSIDIREFPSGVYFLSIQTRDVQRVVKVLRE